MDKEVATKSAAKRKTGKRAEANRSPYVPPLTVSHDALLVDGSDDRFRQLIYLFVEVLGRMNMCREAFGRSIGLTGSQFAVLVGVAHRQQTQGVTIKKLAQYIHLAPTHVTTEVGRLIRKGLLSKSASDDDRRSVLVRLTREGEDMVSSVNIFVRRVNDILFDGLTSADIDHAEGMFNRLSRNSEFAIAELKVAEREQNGRD
ncbi:MAG: winged helix DNA-binding protein [Rhizobiaceae bacterium]